MHSLRTFQTFLRKVAHFSGVGIYRLMKDDRLVSRVGNHVLSCLIVLVLDDSILTTFFFHQVAEMARFVVLLLAAVVCVSAKSLKGKSQM